MSEPHSAPSPESHQAVTSQASYEKLRLAIRYWLLGRGYHKALRAMEFAASYHTGLRKDGSPEFSHQVWQLAYARTLEKLLIEPEEVFVTIFLHDTVEDNPEVTLEIIEAHFGPASRRNIDDMSKVVGGVKKPDDVYFGALAENPVASVAKGIDRIHNHQSMRGAFSAVKQGDYLGESEADILPMLKAARRRFPELEPVLENIKHMLISQIELYRYALSQPA